MEHRDFRGVCLFTPSRKKSSWGKKEEFGQSGKLLILIKTEP